MYRFRTIRFRLTLWYVLLLGLTLLGFSLYLFVELRANLINQVDRSVQTGAIQALTRLETSSTPRFSTGTTTGAVVGEELKQSGVSLRLIDNNGNALDGLGAYQTLPPWSPDGPGYATLVNESGIWRVYSRPLQFRGDEVTVWLQSVQSLDGVYNTLDNFLMVIVLGMPLILVVASAGGMFLADRALRPVDRMTRTAGTIEADQLDRRIGYTGPPDEIGRLAQTLDKMLGRLQTSFKTERRFTADASHELRTPLTVIKGNLDVALSRERSTQDYVETLQNIHVENERLIRLVNRLLYLAQLDAAPLQPRTEQLDPGELLQPVVEQVHLLAAERQITITCETPPMPSIYGNTDHLIQLFLNLIENAVKYTHVGGAVQIMTAYHKPNIKVIIRDNGPGIPEEHLPHLFKRFYRVQSANQSKGTGLGLAVAHSIAIEHGGTIAVESRVGRGTTFTVQLPVKRGSA